MAARVLWVVKGLGPGGAERLLVAAAQAHDHTYFQIECAYVLPWKDHLAGELESAGVRCTCVHPRRRDWRWPWRLRQVIAEGGFDIVHVHSPLPGSVARLAVATLPKAKRPVVMSTEHNSWGTFAAPTRWPNRLTGRRDAAVFAVTDEVRASMRGPAAAKAQTLVHGIDVARVAGARRDRATVRAELGLAPDELVVGTVANYREQKDYPNLLAAARLLADRGVRVRFVAVGQGPLADEVEALCDSLGLADRVILTGFRPDAVRVMAACDVFTMASRWEGLPVALMEALALGLPVVATDVGGVHEAMHDGVDALLVPPGDAAALADALRRVVEDAELRAKLADAAERRGADFDVHRAVDVLETTYHRLAPEASTTPVERPAPPKARRIPGLDLRPATPDDRPAIRTLLGRSLGWSDDPRYAELFEWKHDDNPFGPSAMWVATDASRVVSLRAFMRWEFERDGEILRAVRAVDTATDPDYQGRGLFTAMTMHGVEELTADGVDFVFNTPNAQSRPGYLKMGWRQVGRPDVAVRLAGVRGAAKLPQARVASDLWAQPTDIGVAFEEWFARAGGASVSRGPAGPRDIRTHQSAEFLAWRYGFEPLKYRVLDEPGSAVVFRLRRRGTALEVVVAERFGDIAQADRLVRGALVRCHADHALRLGRPTPSAGFIPLPGAGPILTWRRLSQPGMPPLSSWQLQLGDVELF